MNIYHCAFFRRGRAPIAPACLAFAVTGHAQTVSVAQTYYVPLPEEEVRAALDLLSPGPVSNAINSVVSIAISRNDTVIVYDHFEDGFDASAQPPRASSTEVWGDMDADNGNVCRFFGPCDEDDETLDTLSSGDVLVLDNGGNPTALPVAGMGFGGRDKFSSNNSVAVTRVAWAPVPGTLLAGAVEVTPTKEWGSFFEAPLGEISDASGTVAESSEMFELVTVSYMASSDGTVLEFDNDADNVFGDLVSDPDDPGGPFVSSVELDEGETFLVPLAAPLQLGAQARVAGGEKVVQSHAITGDIGARFESRWAIVLPRESWGDEYFVPVSTRGSDTDDSTDVFVFNPDDSASISVSWEVSVGSCALVDGALNTVTPVASATVAPNTQVRFRLPNGTGARFSTQPGDGTSGPDFYAIATVDSRIPDGPEMDADNNRDFDWGLALVPTDELSTEVLVGFAPAIDPTQCAAGMPYDCVADSIIAPPATPVFDADSGFAGSPVWVMSTQDPALAGSTTVYVDFDGDDAPDTCFELSPLQRERIFDNRVYVDATFDCDGMAGTLATSGLAEDDNDNTGTRLFTIDGTRLAAAWGQDPESSVRGAPYLDAGTFVTAQPLVLIAKDVDQVLVAPGSATMPTTLTYTIVVSNNSGSQVTDLQVTDDLPDGVSYVPGSTVVGDTPQPDDLAGATLFPLDADGGDLVAPFGLSPRNSVGDSVSITFRAVVDPAIAVDYTDADACTTLQTQLVNGATVTDVVTGDALSDEAETCVRFMPAIDIRKQAEGSDEREVPSGSDVDYVITVTNTGQVDLVNVVVSDTQMPACASSEQPGGVPDLAVGESFSYVCTAEAVTVGFTNVADVVASAPAPDGTEVTDSDPSTVTVLVAGGEGCTPGYWKQPHHFDSYPAPLTSDTLFTTAFGLAPGGTFSGLTLVDVLKLRGGGIKALGRHAVAALLNATSTGVSYDLVPDAIIAEFILAAAGNKRTQNAQKDIFEGFNEQGCPLN